MDLYERLLEQRLLEEQAKDERRWGEALPKVSDLESKVLVRRLAGASRRRPGYAANLSMMHRLNNQRP